MNETKSYRLGEYRIMEYDGVMFTWERHAALAEELSGRCFLCGDILVIGDCSRQQTGYLIGEFIEQLQKFPAWDKTRYYCLAASLLEVDTGHRLTDSFFAHPLSQVKKPGLDLRISSGPGTFRLAQYQITVADSSSIEWQAHEGLNKIAGGRCMVESGVLFIGPKEFEKESQSRQEFLERLNKLTKWDKTEVWSNLNVLLPCSQKQQKIQTPSAGRPAGKIENSFHCILPATACRNHYQKITTGTMSLYFKSITTLRQHMHLGKRWKSYLISLLVIVLILAIIIILFVDKGLLHHWAKEHHHKIHERD